MRRTLLVIAVVLLLPTTASAQGVLDRTVDTLRLDPVYVDPDAERAISDGQAEDLRALITSEDAGPLYLAILPASAAREAGGSPDGALREIGEGVGEPGTYAVIVGDSFRAGATRGLLSEDPGGLAAGALEAERDAGTVAVLEEFVRRVGAARRGEDGASGDGGGDGGSSGFGIVLAVLVALGVGMFALSRRRRRKQEESEFAAVRDAARDDVIALGQDIRALDLDMEMPDADPEAKQHYALAVERYQQADQALEAARRPADLEAVTSLLEEGRWAMEAARAEMAGQSAPERRPPCFFDPRHGPSVSDVEWAPAGGQPRPVPVCAADATRMADGEDPEMRQVRDMDGRMVPYWQAGPAFGPWAGGFFGGGLLPGLFVGSMLGGGFGVFGGGAEAEAGDFGDFGGGDFGGGDFGGGDFGGGGDF